MRLKKCTPDADPETNCDVTAWVAHTLPYEEKDYSNNSLDRCTGVYFSVLLFDYTKKRKNTAEASGERPRIDGVRSSMAY